MQLVTKPTFAINNSGKINIFPQQDQSCFRATVYRGSDGNRTVIAESESFPVIYPGASMDISIDSILKEKWMAGHPEAGGLYSLELTALGDDGSESEPSEPETVKFRQNGTGLKVEKVEKTPPPAPAPSPAPKPSPAPTPSANPPADTKPKGLVTVRDALEQLTRIDKFLGEYERSHAEGKSFEWNSIPRMALDMKSARESLGAQNDAEKATADYKNAVNLFNNIEPRLTRMAQVVNELREAQSQRKGIESRITALETTFHTMSTRLNAFDPKTLADLDKTVNDLKLRFAVFHGKKFLSTDDAKVMEERLQEAIKRLGVMIADSQTRGGDKGLGTAEEQRGSTGKDKPAGSTDKPADADRGTVDTGKAPPPPSRPTTRNAPEDGNARHGSRRRFKTIALIVIIALTVIMGIIAIVALTFGFLGFLHMNNVADAQTAKILAQDHLARNNDELNTLKDRLALEAWQHPPSMTVIVTNVVNPIITNVTQINISSPTNVIVMPQPQANATESAQPAPILYDAPVVPTPVYLADGPYVRFGYSGYYNSGAYNYAGYGGGVQDDIGNRYHYPYPPNTLGAANYANNNTSGRYGYGGQAPCVRGSASHAVTAHSNSGGRGRR